MTSEVEVRYHMLRPGQVVARRKDTPVVYIPIGTLEWHGVHNPLGADTLQAEGLAILCARKGGGLVFPPLYYGESRVEGLMEANATDRDKISELMELSPDNFLRDRMPHTAMQQAENYQNLLLHILGEAQSLGFALGVLVVGHYPLIDHVRAAALRFNQQRTPDGQRGGMMVWALLDFLLVQDRWAEAGDHAGSWETSHLMALHPQTVDLGELPPKGRPMVGVHSKTLPPQDSTEEFGRETLEASADVAVREVRHRLEHPNLYRAHGMSLAEGLWKNK